MDNMTIYNNFIVGYSGQGRKQVCWEVPEGTTARETITIGVNGKWYQCGPINLAGDHPTIKMVELIPPTACKPIDSTNNADLPTCP